MLFGINFDDIDINTLQMLIENGVPESVHLDYKRVSYGNNDDQRKELLKDVSSFANTLGGYLFLGMDEKDGIATSIKPLAVTNLDDELSRLESIIRTGIEPTMIGMRMKRIDIDDSGVIVIHIPRSYNPPHRTNFKGSLRYWARNSAQTYELSLEELRQLFGERRSIEERAHEFVRERFLRIQAGDGILPLASNYILVMHILPLPDFGAKRRIELSQILNQKDYFRPIGSNNYNSRINLEGICIHRVGRECHGYTQVYRNGIIEATSASIFTEREGKLYFFPKDLTERLINSLSRYMKGLQRIEAAPPLMLKISAINISGLHMGFDRLYELPVYTPETLHLPATIITEFASDDNYEHVIAEQMDFLWNAFDFERCELFDRNGQLIEDSHNF